MRISGLVAIGILLITTNVSYSLVVLSANLEDIKKIARHFVSETVADHIGKLFVHTSPNRKIDISEENNLNNDVNKVSTEDFETRRANKSSSEDVEMILREAMQRVKEMKDVVNDVNKMQKKPEKEKWKTTKDTVTTKASTKTSDHYTYDFILTPEKTLKPKYEWKKGLNLDFFTTAIPDIYKQNDVFKFTRGAISDGENDSRVNRIDLSSELEDRRYVKSNKRLEPGVQHFKYNPVTNRSKQSEKVRTEDKTTSESVLDYDNSIYIKKEILATSGPVDLYKITALKDLTSTSSEYYNIDKENKFKDANVDLYFRKLLDSKLKLYKNDTKVIKAKANVTIEKFNKTKRDVKTTKLSSVRLNTTKQFKRKATKGFSYSDESYFYD